MKRSFFCIAAISSALLFPCALSAQAPGNCSLTGRVTCEGQPVEGVKVSDGIRIVKTDENGVYRIDSDKRQGFVFMTTPSGYVPVSADGLQPDFYSALSEQPAVKETHDFSLRKEKQDRYSVIILTDAHLTNADFKPDLKTFKESAMPNVRAQAARLAAKGPVYTMNLGDLSHDLYWYTYSYNLQDAYNTLKEAGWPTLTYSVSGNHDNDGAIATKNTDRDAEHLYRKVLGPEYYSIDLGKEHWIMMDDILYINNPGKGKKVKGIAGDRSYEAGFTRDEMTWLAEDLKLLPDNTPVRLCVHAPIVFDNSEGTLFRPSQTDSLASLFSRFGTVDVMCGHVHRMQFLNSDKWPVFKEVEVPALSGDMWTTSPVPTIGGEGEDAGILIARFGKGPDCSYEYVTHRFGRKWMRVYDMNSVQAYYRNDPDIRAQMKEYPERKDYADGEYTNWIYVNFWFCRPGQTVEILEKGKKLDVLKVPDEDPVCNLNQYLYVFRKNPAFKDKYSRITVHNMFSAKAATSDATVKVIVRDASGKIIHKEKVKRPKGFAPNME